MRRFVLVLLVVLAALGATLAVAVSGSTAPVVTEVLGRRVVYYNHFGDPFAGRVQASAQGQVLDTNGNGLPDSLQGRGALLEVRKVRRIAIYNLTLQVFRAGAWRTAVNNPIDVVSPGQPAYVKQLTAPARLCAYSTPDRLYRVVHRDGIRWDDGTLGTRTTVSNEFTWRMLSNDPECVAPPPPPPPAPEADVQVTKTASMAQVVGTADTNFAYTITVRNLDTTDAASNVVVTDTLPGEVDLNGALPANCTDTNPDPATVALRCTFGTLDPGEVDSVTINVTADASDFADGTIANTAQVTSSTADPNPANNTSSVNVLVRPLADVTVDKEADQASVTVPGDNFRYVIRVANTGPSAATAVTVIDQLPEGLEIVALPAGCVNDADPTAEPDTITCSFGTLAAGASASVSIDVVTDASRADDTLPYVNTARVTTSTYEQDTSDNADTETTPVVPA
jgi:uncharacterized repeat protein (TIGR01451 family)